MRRAPDARSREGADEHTREGADAHAGACAGAAAGASRPRRARARPSLKMQAIGYLSRREYSRQELRRKLLAWLRQRERDDAALAAAAQKAAREEAEALRDWPANGIDDAFLPARLQAQGDDEAFVDVDDIDDDVAPPRRRATARAESAAPGASGDATAAALASLRRADGAPIPVAVQRALAALAVEPRRAIGTVGAEAAVGAASPMNETDAARQARLEREDPEAAVDQLLDWLAAQRYLSDTRFVESRVNARARKQGTAMIKHELARHGLALEPEQAAALRESEFARAHALWQRKFGAVAADARERARQARFLAARGFAADVVRRIVGGEEPD